MQRLRIRFRRGEELKFISHLDLIRLWQRALNRAGVPVAYSEGFNPHQRLSLAAPLAVGVTSEAELMDVVLSKWMSPHAFAAVLKQQLPPGTELLQVYQIPPTMSSLQSQVSYAEYQVELTTKKGRKDIESAIAELLSLKRLPWQHQRDTGPRHYDLRALIDDLWLISWRDGSCTIGMRLRSGSSGSGRPEQVALALGFEGYPRSIHRTQLTLRTS